jgi:hypothetical protein
VSEPEGQGVCRELTLRVFRIAHNRDATEQDTDELIDTEEAIHEAMFRAKFCACPCQREPLG